MSILGNNLLAEYYAQNQGLPDGYEAIEYLGSTGGQWIDTGVILDPLTYEYETQFSLTYTSGTHTFSLSYGMWRPDYLAAIIGVGTWNEGRIVLRPVAGYSASGGVLVGWEENDVITMSLHGTNLIYNGTSYAFDRAVTGIKPEVTQVIFGTHRGDTSKPLELSTAKCWYYKLWTSSTVKVRDFIPCIRKSDSKPGLYDLCRSVCPITGTPFYINAGIGEFVIPT